MPLPLPHPVLVIGYSYLWRTEHIRGDEEGRKNRPCAIVAMRQVAGETVIVTVFPITHRAPENEEDGVELPPLLKQHLGLDDARSWVTISEVNEFVWPGLISGLWPEKMTASITASCRQSFCEGFKKPFLPGCNNVR